MLGASEYVADALAETIEKAGGTSQIHLQPNADDINKENIWIICSSTHGAGDLPDNIHNFAKQLEQESLYSTDFIVIGLGDTSYDTYCGAAKTLQNKMLKAGATLLKAPLYIDVLEHPVPEEAAVEWFESWLSEQSQFE